MLNWFKKKSSTGTVEAAANNDASPRASLAQRNADRKAGISDLVTQGMQFHTCGDFAAAADIFERVLVLEPLNLVALYQIANGHLATSQLSLASQACQRALELLPDQTDLLLLMATIQDAANDFDAKLAALLRLRSVQPLYPEIELKIAEALCTLGRGHEAIAAFDRAIEANPHELSRRSSRLFYLNYFGSLDRQALFEEHRKWGAMIDEGWLPYRQPHSNSCDNDRALTVGFVSGDLRSHAVALFIEGYFAEHDRERFVIHCFDVSPHREDDVTLKLRGLVERWHRVADLDDDALADEIRRQGVDVLVDLSGHTMFNRLLVFARRPAPVQVSWFGYMNTTGLSSIDYRLTDAGVDPGADSDAFYTEKLVRLPSLACFTPHHSSPAVSPPPYLVRNRLAFVSANQWTKVTADVRSLWAEILCDDSRPSLRIIARSGDSARFRDTVIAEMCDRGVRADQIEVIPRMSMADFLAAFGEVDIALDPFPYGGGTTTLHTIWMGVPIISLEGDTELGRATPAMLRGFGLSDFVAQTREQYRDKAIALARDPSPLVDIRANLRQRMAESAALDAKGLARNVESAFRTMWHTYCAANSETSRTDTQVK